MKEFIEELKSSNAIVRPVKVENGFRLLEIIVEGSYPFYAVKPNHSIRTFYFEDVEKALAFCRHYRNEHGDAFWLRRWHPTMSLRNIQRMRSFNNLNY